MLLRLSWLNMENPFLDKLLLFKVWIMLDYGLHNLSIRMVVR
jgi:hypothetical protein